MNTVLSEKDRILAIIETMFNLRRLLKIMSGRVEEINLRTLKSATRGIIPLAPK